MVKRRVLWFEAGTWLVDWLVVWTELTPDTIRAPDSGKHWATDRSIISPEIFQPSGHPISKDMKMLSSIGRFAQRKVMEGFKVLQRMGSGTKLLGCLNDSLSWVL